MYNFKAKNVDVFVIYFNILAENILVLLFFSCKLNRDYCTFFLLNHVNNIWYTYIEFPPISLTRLKAHMASKHSGPKVRVLN